MQRYWRKQTKILLCFSLTSTTHVIDWEDLNLILGFNSTLEYRLMRLSLSNLQLYFSYISSWWDLGFPNTLHHAEHYGVVCVDNRWSNNGYRASFDIIINNSIEQNQYIRWRLSKLYKLYLSQHLYSQCVTRSTP